MEIEPIIEQLRLHAPLFEGRVAGAAQFSAVTEATALALPCAFVVPLDDSPEPSVSQNSVRQHLEETFEVVVALDNRPDERGQSAASSVHHARAALWKALLGWRPNLASDGLVYEGGNVMALDRARLWWRFEFSAATEIGPEDGFQEASLAALPPFDGLRVTVDTAPADGQPEHLFDVPRTGNFSQPQD